MTPSYDSSLWSEKCPSATVTWPLVTLLQWRNSSWDGRWRRSSPWDRQCRWLSWERVRVVRGPWTPHLGFIYIVVCVTYVLTILMSVVRQQCVSWCDIKKEESWEKKICAVIETSSKWWHVCTCYSISRMLMAVSHEVAPLQQQKEEGGRDLVLTYSHDALMWVDQVVRK